MSYIPTNDDINDMAMDCVTLCTAMVAREHPLLDTGKRTSVALTLMTSGAANMAMIAMAMDELLGHGITCSPSEFVEKVFDLTCTPEYVDRLRRLHDRLKRVIVEETGLSEVKAPDSQPDN